MITKQQIWNKNTCQEERVSGEEITVLWEKWPQSLIHKLWSAPLLFTTPFLRQNRGSDLPFLCVPAVSVSVLQPSWRQWCLALGLICRAGRDASSSPTHCSFMFPWGQQPPRHSLGSLERGARSAGFMPPQRGPTCLCYLCSHTAPTPPSREQGLRTPRRLFFFSVNKARPLHAQDHSGKMLLPESGSLVRIIENFGSSVLVSALLNFMQVPGFTK